jgi:hypothetical protein
MPLSRWITNKIRDTAGIEALGGALGSYQGYLRISDSSKGVKSATVQYFPFKVFVKRGPVTLSLDDSPRNFDTIAFCEVKDTTIEIKNLGCDTLHISQTTISDPNFIIISPATLPDSASPLIVKPYDSTSITVEYLPDISNGASGSLSIFTDADSAKDRIVPLAGFAIPTDTINFKAVATNITVAPGDTSTILIMPGSDYKSVGLNSINISIEYNGDIMTPFNITSTVSGIPGATVSFKPEIPLSPKIQELPVVISGKNMQLDSTKPLVRIQFLIYLSDSLSTDFRVVNFQLNNGDFNFGKCILGSITDTGTIDLKLYCGDTLLYNLLRYGGTDFGPEDGISPLPGLVYPNPVLEPTTLSIPFRALRAVSVGVEILDWSGAVVYSGSLYAPEAGIAVYPIWGLQLPSGAYHYRLHPLDGGKAVSIGGFVVLK